MARIAGSKSRKVSINGRYRAWQSMRMLRRFRTGDIIATAEVSFSNIVKYLSALQKTGYLRRIGRQHHGRNAPLTWQLIDNTGPNPPRVCRDGKTVYDPNTGEERHYD